jgi:hypothetical protein
VAHSSHSRCCAHRPRRRSACLARAGALLLLCAALLLLLRARGAATGRSAARRPRRALQYVPVYATFPYHKVLDCFAIGLQMVPLELAQCVAWSSV